MVAMAIGLAIGALRLDVLLASMVSDLMPWFGSMGAEAARKILTTTASTMVTVAGVVFSITIVALQLASSQFGPRLLRNFMSDRANQIVLGTFTSAFVYCLVVLAAVRDDPHGFVPVMAVWFGLFLGVAGIGVLIFFIHHIAQSIRVEKVVANVAAELDAAVDRLFPEEIGEEPDKDEMKGQLPADFSRRSRSICAKKAGYIRGIDADSLLRVAKEHRLLVRLERRPGDFVYTDMVLASAYPGDRLDRDTAGSIESVFTIGIDRTPLQDIDYVLRQLVQIALRALSPAINDPFTAMECINRLTQGLRRVSARARPSQYRYDSSGMVRVISQRDELLPLVISSLDPIARAGGDNVDIIALLIEATDAITKNAIYRADRDRLSAFALSLKRESETRLTRDQDQRRIEHLGLANGRCRSAGEKEVSEPE